MQDCLYLTIIPYSKYAFRKKDIYTELARPIICKIFLRKYLKITMPREFRYHVKDCCLIERLFNVSIECNKVRQLFSLCIFISELYTYAIAYYNLILFIFMSCLYTGDKTKLQNMVQMAWTFINDRYNVTLYYKHVYEM